jgi:hypothetical protein
VVHIGPPQKKFSLSLLCIATTYTTPTNKKIFYDTLPDFSVFAAMTPVFA